jgi:hypothetical protein
MNNLSEVHSSRRNRCRLFDQNPWEGIRPNTQDSPSRLGKPTGPRYCLMRTAHARMLEKDSLGYAMHVRSKKYAVKADYWRTLATFHPE